MSSPSDLIAYELYTVRFHKLAEVPVTRSPKAAGKGGKLSNYLCFAVYSANLAFGRAYKPILDAVGLTYTQYIAMVALSEADEQTVSVLDSRNNFSPSALTVCSSASESATMAMYWV